ncbi:hypothetical protein V8F06_003114 [Rhypophila decipiens]
MEAPDSSAKAGLGGNPPLTTASSSTSSLGVSIPTPPERSNSQSGNHKSAHMAAHRQSFADNQRYPPSPRSQRHPSFTQQAVQEMMNNPPNNRNPNPRYAGKDWRDLAVGEFAVPEEVRWVDFDTSVEEATMTLLKNNPNNVVLIRENSTSKTAVSTFDHNDLNAYLLVVVALATPEEDQIQLYQDISSKAQSQTPIYLREIQPICRKEQLVTLEDEAPLNKAIEIFGSGIHRILVTDPNGEVVGILNQLRVLEFFWNEAVNFPMIERLYTCPLRDLPIGTQKIISINADAPLAEALLTMNNEGLTSVAVVDNGFNVVGNISTADTRLLTNAASLPLLENTCMHFISVILSERGVERGRDSFPVFYVSPHSTLAHTVAKLVATHSHRMWVVESASPSPSAPATPLLQPTQPAATPSSIPSFSGGIGAGRHSPSPGPGPSAKTPASPLPTQTFASVPASALPGACLSGRLTGVVSLTDILNLFALKSGLSPSDPSEQRARRRRSSSSSVRPSIENGRPSSDLRR